MPDVLSILTNGTVSGKEACFCDIAESFLIPERSVLIIVEHNLVNLEVGLKVSETHIRISDTAVADNEIVEHIRKRHTVKSDRETVNSISDTGVYAVVVGGVIAVLPKLLDLT